MSTPALPGDTLGTLPALKKLGRLADLRPVAIIDSREQDPLLITRLETVRAGLQTGDYSFIGGEHLFSTERKSLDDIVACCMGENRLRFERECGRLRGMKFKRLLIVGPKWMIEGHRYRSAIKPKSVLHSIASWEMRFDLPVVWAEHPTQAAEMVESWVWWFTSAAPARSTSTTCFPDLHPHPHHHEQPRTLQTKSPRVACGPPRHRGA